MWPSMPRESLTKTWLLETGSATGAPSAAGGRCDPEPRIVPFPSKNTRIPFDAGAGRASLRVPAYAALLGSTSRTMALPSWSSATSSS